MDNFSKKIKEQFALNYVSSSGYAQAFLTNPETRLMIKEYGVTTREMAAATKILGKIREKIISHDAFKDWFFARAGFKLSLELRSAHCLTTQQKKEFERIFAQNYNEMLSD